MSAIVVLLQTCIENSSILVRGAAPENEGNMSSAIVTPARRRQRRVKLLSFWQTLFGIKFIINAVLGRKTLLNHTHYKPYFVFLYLVQMPSFRRLCPRYLMTRMARMVRWCPCLTMALKRWTKRSGHLRRLPIQQV